MAHVCHFNSTAKYFAYPFCATIKIVARNGLQELVYVTILIVARNVLLIHFCVTIKIVAQNGL